MHADRLREAEQSIWKARPHAVASTAVKAVTTLCTAVEAEIYLADYPMTFLIPVMSCLDPVRMDNTPAGHAFAAQRTIVEAPDGPAEGPCRTHLPITVQGDRLGILTVSSAQELAAEELVVLSVIATVIARALKIADLGTDMYRRVRRRDRLTLAAEIQWELLPGRSCRYDEYDLAGHLEPAYTVCGDSYDWAASAEKLTVTVSNGRGQGTPAALLTHLAVSAMRNARRSGSGLVDQATLANEVICSQYGGDHSVATLLLEFDTTTGEARAVDAGSPQIWRMRGGKIDQIELTAQMPLGMFHDTDFTEQRFTVEPGDRLVIASDGVHGAVSPRGDRYGATALTRALRRTRLQDPAEAVRSLTRSLLDHYEDTELTDDAVFLCMDWTGRV
ncbi:MAG TPA: PP2C family protein-serine/threonine phosphatase [Actinomadura sp.]|jgi:serine phosphatase RsbU (regulator of sigma subunit)|nr:PP2C family protein-serine/threonine phosphatase [Actinomadura sp.]